MSMTENIPAMICPFGKRITALKVLCPGWWLCLAVLLQRRQQSKPLRNHGKLRKRTNLQLLHDLMPMQLARSVGYSKLISNLLVRLSFHQVKKDLLLACCQPGVKRPKREKLVVLFLNGLVAGQSALDGLQQHLFRDRFGKEILGTGLDRLHGRRDVAVPAYKNDWKPAAYTGKLLLELRPAQSGHLHVEQNAGRPAIQR